MFQMALKKRKKNNKLKVKHKKSSFLRDVWTTFCLLPSVFFSNYHPPLPPFFFFCGAFLRVAPEAAGFCCRGGTTLLPVDPDTDPGLGEVGGLLTVLLASLWKTERPNQQWNQPSGSRGDSNRVDPWQRGSLQRARTDQTMLLLLLPVCLFRSAPSSCPSSCLCSRSAPSWAATSRGQGLLWGRSFWVVFLKKKKKISRNRCET